jgi:hypothetical protein
MKNLVIKTVIILIGLGFTINANAATSDVNVPDQVTAAFIATYPQAKLKDWKIAKAGYKAEFKLNHRKCTAVYAPDGTLLKSETKLGRTQDMPLAVKTALKKGKYAAYHVDEIKEVETAGETQYVLTIDNHGGSTMATEGYGAWEDYQVVFENNGILTDVKEL